MTPLLPGGFSKRKSVMVEEEESERGGVCLCVRDRKRKKNSVSSLRCNTQHRLELWLRERSQITAQMMLRLFRLHRPEKGDYLNPFESLTNHFCCICLGKRTKKLRAANHNFTKLTWEDGASIVMKFHHTNADIERGYMKPINIAQ